MTQHTDPATILIVDDTLSNLSVAVSLFESNGYRVAVAQDGEEGLQRAALVQPDLILLDVMLPGVDGFEVCRRLKQQESTRDIPVIFMTALASVEHKVQGFQAGGVDYVTKPLQFDEVAARVETQLSLSRMRRTLEAQNAELQRYRDELEQRVQARTLDLDMSNRRLREEVDVRKMAQQALAAREREFRTLVENAPDEIARHDRQGRFIYINPQHEKTLGIPLANLVGKTHVECFPGIPDVVAYHALLMEVIETGRTAEYDATLPDTGDGPRYHSILLVPERGADGEIAGVLAIGRDITELKRAEADVRERELRYRLLFENSPISIWEEDFSAVYSYFAELRQAGVEDLAAHFDAHPEAVGHCAELARIVDVNRAAVTLHRAQSKAELFAGLAQTFTPDSFRAFREELLGLWRGETEMKLDAVVQTLAGEPRHVVVHFTIAPDTGMRWSKVLVSVVDITERKQAEQQLAMLGAAIDHAHEAAYFVDENGGFSYVNEEASRMLGYSREALLGMTVMAIAPGWTPEVMAESWQAISKAGALTIEAEHRHKDGRIIPVEINITHMNYGGRAFNLAMVRDITERKRAERELQLLNSAVNASTEAVFLMNEQGRFVYVNEEACRSLGLRRDELLGMTPLDIDADLTPEAFQGMLDLMVAGSQNNIPIESRHRSRDGRVFPVEIVGSPITLEGQSYGLAMVRDITERKRAERELHLLNHALDNAFDATYLIDDDMRLRYVNEAAVRALGYSREELLAMTLPDIDPSLKPEMLKALMAQTNASGRYPGIVETQHRRKDGSVFPIEVGATVFDYEGEHLHLTVVRDITERKRAEELLREERGLFVGGPTVVFKWKAEDGWPVEYVSPNVLVQFGYPAERFMDGSLLFGSLVHPADLARVADEVATYTAQGRTSYEQEYRIAHADGGYRWIYDFTIVNRKPDGAVSHYHGYVMDITDRKSAEQALTEREREFRTLAENIPDNIIRYDRNGRKIYLNTATARLMGIKPEEVLNQTPEETPEEKRAMKIDGFAEHLRRVLETGEPQELELMLRHAEKGMQVHNVRFVAERDEQGEIVGALMVGRDITAMKAIENELMEREQRYREIFDNAVEGMYLLEVTEDGRFRNIEINPALAASTGISREAMIGRFVDETVPEEVGRAIVEKYRRVVATGETITEVIELDLPAGVRTYYSTITPIYLGDKVRRLIGISRDITELKRVERELQESRAQLRGMAARREAVREEERKYIAREVHDELGQILTGLQLNVSVLKHKFAAATPELGEQLKDTMMLADKALGVARNVASALRPSALDMGIVSAMEWLAERFGANTGIRCEVHVDDYDMQLDEARAIALFRIVQESLTNVARHAKATWVGIDLGREGDDYWLKVRDNGAGFDPAVRKADSYGLVGMRERALVLGGEVVIDSAPGRGTEVSVRIPAINVARMQ